MALRPDCPVLAKGTRVVKQVEDGKTTWIVRAGATGKYLRVGESEALLLELMDGKRTAEEVRVGWVARRKENLYDGYTYGTTGTPTSRELEARIAALEGGGHCVVVPSGQAALCLAALAFARAPPQMKPGTGVTMA